MANLSLMSQGSSSRLWFSNFNLMSLESTFKEEVSYFNLMSQGSSSRLGFSNLNLMSLGSIFKVEVSYFNLMSQGSSSGLGFSNLHMMSLGVINTKVEVSKGSGPLEVIFTMEAGTNKGNISNI